MGGGDEDVGEDDGAVDVDYGDDDAPAAFRRHRKRGEGPPSSSSSSLTFSLDGRRVFPLVHGLHGGGGARAPRRLGLSQFPSVSALLGSSFSPFLKFSEIRNFD